MLPFISALRPDSGDRLGELNLVEVDLIECNLVELTAGHAAF